MTNRLASKNRETSFAPIIAAQFGDKGAKSRAKHSRVGVNPAFTPPAIHPTGQFLKPQMPAYDFNSPRLLCRSRSGGGHQPAPGRAAGALPAACAAPYPRRRGAAVQRPRRRMAGAHVAPAGKRALQLDVIVADPPANPGGKPRLCLRAAQIRPARLYGAEGRRDGRLAPNPGAHRSTLRSTRLNLDRLRANAVEAAEQCGILRLPGDRAGALVRALDRRLRPGAPAGVLRRGRGGARPGSPRWRTVHGPPTRRLRSRSSSARRAGSRPPSARRCCGFRTSCGWRSGRASCAPTRRRLPPSHWCRRCWATGADSCLAKGLPTPDAASDLPCGEGWGRVRASYSLPAGEGPRPQGRGGEDSSIRAKPT